ncbi:GtrA family protein [Loktanella agnita]|uniref:GtrA family protein n=1 Tax=Loktanella agnita TaxID=287097 RepID=UPI00398582F8
MYRQILRFGLVGVLATALHVAVALTCAQLFGMRAQFANFTGFATSVFFSFVGHSRVTFALPQTQIDFFPRFVAAALIGLATSTAITHLVVSELGQPFWLAMVAVVIAVPALSFSLMKGWVYAQSATLRKEDAIGAFLCMAIAIIILFVFWGCQLNEDTTWYLVATRKWLDGAQLYVDIIEVNPPLNFYYTVPALLIADALEISSLNGLYILFAVFLWVSLLWCWLILSVGPALTFNRRVFFIFGAAIAIIVPAERLLMQREHVYVIFLLPWFLHQLEAAGPHRLGARVRSALFASCGVLLKPYFVLIPVCLTIWKIVTYRSLRPLVEIENWIFMISGLSYIAFVFAFHSAYFEQVVPIARHIYAAYDANWELLIWRFDIRITAPLLVFMLLAIRSEATPKIFELFGAAAIGSGLIYVLQNKGFPYHLLPFLIFITLSAVWLLAQANQVSQVAVLGAVVFMTCMIVSLSRGRYENPSAEQLGAFAAQRGALIVLTEHIAFGPPAALAGGVPWASRMPSQWYVPGVVNGLIETDCRTLPERCDRLQEIATIARDNIVSDMKAFQPAVVALDTSSNFIKDPDFDWWSFMAPQPEFAQIMDAYVLDHQLRHFDIYVLRE